MIVLCTCSPTSICSMITMTDSTIASRRRIAPPMREGHHRRSSDTPRLADVNGRDPRGHAVPDQSVASLNDVRWMQVRRIAARINPSQASSDDGRRRSRIIHVGLFMDSVEANPDSIHVDSRGPKALLLNGPRILCQSWNDNRSADALTAFTHRACSSSTIFRADHRSTACIALETHNR